MIVDGWHGDTSRMYGVGEVPRKAQRLMDITYEAMMRGLARSSLAPRWAISATPSNLYAEAERVRGRARILRPRPRARLS